jgi:hypothetical protein
MVLFLVIALVSRRYVFALALALILHRNPLVLALIRT